MNVDDHDDPADYVWDPSSVVEITLSGDSITVNPPSGATVVGSKVTITTAATYRITGSLTNGQVIVDTEDEATVRLILNGVDITCSTSSPIYVEKAKKAIIILQENTENSLTDGTSYILEPDTDEPNAAIFSRSDLTISGLGSLTVNGNYNDGIASKDGLVVKSGAITVTSVDDGIRGKDYLVVKEGTITLSVGGDGLKSDDDADVARGYVSVENGVITITSDGDAIEAQTDAIITGGQLDLNSGGGSTNTPSPDLSTKGIKGVISVIIDGGNIIVDSSDDAIHSDIEVTINGGTFVLTTGDDGIHADDFIEVNNGFITITSVGDAVEAVNEVAITGGELNITTGGGYTNPVTWSAKGIKGLVNVVVDGGTITANCADDTVHSNMNITINGGTFVLTTGDDGFHADTFLTINGGIIDITHCFEGLESSVINLNDGIIHLVASDDGINIAGGNDGGPADPFAPPDEGQWLHVNGGYTVVDAGGDGIDTNGFMEMNGGTMIINGPDENMNAAIDWGFGDNGFNMTGGTLIAVGSSGMAQGPTGQSTQYSVLINLNSMQTQRLIHFNTSSGEIVTFMPVRRFQSIVYCSPKLAPGQYDLYLGGSSTGTSTDGLYEGGTYTPGTRYTTFTISSIVTTIGGGGWGGGGGGWFR